MNDMTRTVFFISHQTGMDNCETPDTSFARGRLHSSDPMQLFFLLEKCITSNFQTTDIDIKLAATTLSDYCCITLVSDSYSVTSRIQHPLRQLETWQPRSIPHPYCNGLTQYIQRA